LWVLYDLTYSGGNLEGIRGEMTQPRHDCIVVQVGRDIQVCLLSVRRGRCLTYRGWRVPNRSAIGLCLALLLVVVCLAALMPAARAQDPSHDLSWGPVADGLRMSIYRTPSSATPTTAQFLVAIRSVGEKGAVLNMGLMMANGQVLLPTALFLTITDPQKVGRELVFFSDGRRLSGKMDDYVVDLRPGATYTMAVDLSHYWAPATKQFPLRLLTGAHTVVARLVARGAQYSKGDIALPKFWTGTIQSNVLTFQVP
jgi:hypothetical protein